MDHINRTVTYARWVIRNGAKNEAKYMARRKYEYVQFNSYTLTDPPRTRHEQKKLRQAMFEWLLDENFRALPITIIFRKSLKLKDGRCMRLDVQELKKTVRHFMRRLNRRIFGKAACKAGARLECQFIWEDADETGLHVHGRIELPRHLLDHEFEEVLTDVTRGMEWIKYVRPEPDDSIHWVEYILKLIRKGVLQDHFDEVNSWWRR